MSGELERRWDDAVETAWREFRQRLADRLAGMAQDVSLVVEVVDEAVDGTTPYCQVLAGPGVLRIEAVSSLYLADELQLDDKQELVLSELGFEYPSSVHWQTGETNFWADLEQREADKAAVMIVRALRDVYSVLHPVYLAADGLEPRMPTSKAAAPQPQPDQPMSPTSVEDVRAAVDLAVAGIYDDAPRWDDDGDLPLPTERCLLWVVVSKSAPRVLLSCVLLDDVADEAAALTEVNLLNRKELGLTFNLHERRIAVMREIGLDVVVPSALHVEIQRLLGSVDAWSKDLAARVRTGDDSVPDERRNGRFGTAYAVMVELERAQRGSVEPGTMARVFDHDTGLLLKAIRITEQRRREVRAKARRARDDGRRRDEQVARARQEYMRELTSRMRAALRLIVDAPVRKVQLDQLALFDEDEAGTGR